MNKNYPSPVGHNAPKKVKKTQTEFLKDVSLGLVGLSALPFAYTGRLLMFALAVIYVCSREGWRIGMKIQ